MRAVQFDAYGGPEVLHLVELPAPHPGPGEVRIAVRAAGVNPSDWKKRRGLFGEEGPLPLTLGHEAAGVVDEVGEGVGDAAVGDEVFGFSGAEAAQAEYAVLFVYAPIPVGLDFAQAAALPAAVETATRALDHLEVRDGTTVLVNGASGGVGSAAVQLAAARGARVIGTASAANQDYLRGLGAEPVVYGDELIERVRALAPGGVDRAMDVAGNGILGDLVDLAGGAGHVVTLSDFAGSVQHGVYFSTGSEGRALQVVREIGGLIESGHFAVPIVETFPLDQVAEAQRVSEAGHVRGKLVLTVD